MSGKSRGDNKGTKNSNTNTNTNTIRANAVCVLIGNLLGVALFFIFTAIASAVIFKNTLSSSVYLPALIFISALSGLASGFAAVLPIRKNGLIMGLLSSIFTVIAIFASAALSSKSAPGLNAVFVAVTAAICSAVGGILAANMKNKRK